MKEKSLPSNEKIKEILESTSATVVFKKADGTERTMVCTRHPIYLPLVESKEITKRKVSPEVLPVWDIEKGAWRSFRYDSIISIEGYASDD